MHDSKCEATAPTAYIFKEVSNILGFYLEISFFPHAAAKDLQIIFYYYFLRLCYLTHNFYRNLQRDTSDLLLVKGEESLHS